jgi:hypothetical protein
MKTAVVDTGPLVVANFNPLAHIEVRYPSDSSGVIDISLFKSAPPHHNPKISQPC